MKTVIDVIGYILLLGCGLMMLLGVIAVILCEVRVIVRASNQIVKPEEPSRPYFSEPPTELPADQHWQN